jgi:DNA-binding CsgD family transcriptional regulator
MLTIGPDSEVELMESLKLRRLSPREKEVLKIIGQGKTSKEVAEALSLSVATVGNHRKHICAKLDLHSTAELVAFAARYVHGLMKANK